jgi:hypothetical protein
MEITGGMARKLEADSSAAAIRIVNLAHTRATIAFVIEATIREANGLEASTTPLAIAVFLQDVDAERTGTRNIAAVYKLHQAGDALWGLIADLKRKGR